MVLIGFQELQFVGGGVMDGYKIRVRIEIIPESDTTDAAAAASVLDHVEEQIVDTVSKSRGDSIDDMEEVLLCNTYEVMRQTLSRHFAEVSKRGLLQGRARKI